MSAVVPASLLEREFRAVIGGERLAARSGETFATIDPSNGRRIAEVPRGRADDVDEAVRSSEAAFRHHSWAGLKPFERGRLVHELGRAIASAAEELAALESLDTGKPLSQAMGDVRGAARYCEYYAGIADKLEGTHIPLGPGEFGLGSLEPYGVVGIIVPWNSPINQAARSLAPALAVGNTAVIKPAENTPLTAIRLAELALDVGFPPGVVNVVPGYGDEAGQALAEHDLVRKISFTGSVATGQHIAGIAAERLVPSSLELGGKSPCLVFEDADLDAVVESMVGTVTRNAGQVCSAATRILVHGQVVDPLLDRAAVALEAITVGPGIEDRMLGPVVSEVQQRRVLGLIEDGRQAGADVVTGGGAYDDAALAAGYFVQPTIFRSVTHDMRIATEEIFGPVISTLEFDDEAMAIEVANGTEYGLAAGVYTKDIDRALRVSHALEAGQVFVNRYLAGGVETPFGGYKKSGWGREKGLAALHDYTQLKTTIFSFG
jgi:aldehyde dehydrogenase (NAD+)